MNEEKPAAEVGTETGLTPIQRGNITRGEWWGIAVGGTLLGVVIALLVAAAEAYA